MKIKMPWPIPDALSLRSRRNWKKPNKTLAKSKSLFKEFTSRLKKRKRITMPSWMFAKRRGVKQKPCKNVSKKPKLYFTHHEINEVVLDKASSRLVEFALELLFEALRNVSHCDSSSISFGKELVCRQDEFVFIWVSWKISLLRLTVVVMLLLLCTLLLLLLW